MYEKFFGLSENPFSLTPDPRFIFSSRSHDEALAHLRYWVEHREGFAMITGEVGTGKTTALFRLIEGMARHYEIAFLTNSTLTAVELLEEICRKFRIEVDRELTKPALLSRLEAYLVRLNEMGHGAVLIIDEAQNFDHHLLEEVRLLSNVTRPGGTPLLQIALIGQPELERKLGQPELRQLKQRIGVHYRIEPLSAEETARYVHHRVTVAGGFPKVLFPAETLNVLFDRTHGLPREINQVASQSLLHAYVEESNSVRKDHVASAIEEMNFRSVLDRGMTLTVTPNPAATGIGMASLPNPGIAATPARSTLSPAVARVEPAEVTHPGPETIPAPPPRPRFRPETAAPATRPAHPSRSRVPSFGALPPVGTSPEGMTEVRNPLFRRLLVTAGAVVILAVAGILLFAPPKGDTVGVSEMETEPTLPSAPASDRNRPAAPLPLQSSTSPGATDTGTTAGAREPVSTPAPAVAAPVPAVRDSTPHRQPAPAAPASLKGFYLQIASFRDSATAESIGRGYASRTHYVHRVERSGTSELPWYAVYLGPFATTAEAESGRVELSRLDSSLAGAIIRDRR